MKKLVKLVLLLMVVGVVAGAVAAYVSRKKFESMSDEEIRGFLANKLEGKVAADQLTSIQDAVIAGVRSKTGGKRDLSVDDVEDAVANVEDAVADLEDAVADVVEDAAD